MRRVLRSTAIAIVLAAIVDPVVTIDGATRARIAVVVDDSRPADGVRVGDILSRDLGGVYQIESTLTSDVAAAIVIGVQYPEPAVSGFAATFAGAISTVTLPPPHVAIAHVAAPHETLRATNVRIEADVDAHDAAGQTTEVIARLEGIEVGRASHQWTRAIERWTASFDVAPFGEPPFVVRLDAGSSSAEVMVARRTRPIRVQAYDPRPSWTSTFTRRALEADARFQIESFVASSRAVAARTAGVAPLADSRVDDFDALLIGGADALSAADARAVDRFIRVRGGAVVALPDSRALSTAALELLAGGGVAPTFKERLLEHPATLISARALGALQSSELLLPGAAGVGAEVLASTPGKDGVPVIVSTPYGRGRLIFSGALDAWRFRAAADRGFDRFWQAVIAGAALASPSRVDLTVTPAPLGRGEEAEVVVRARGANAAANARATADGNAVRLWPTAEEGVYRGTFVVGMSEGRTTVRATVSDAGGDADATLIVPVRSEARHAGDATVAPLRMLAATHGGIDVDPDHVDELVRFVRASVRPPHAPLPSRPMRSPWWIAAFTGCLGGEWWLRRRRGLR